MTFLNEQEGLLGVSAASGSGVPKPRAKGKPHATKGGSGGGKKDFGGWAIGCLIWMAEVMYRG